MTAKTDDPLPDNSNAGIVVSDACSPCPKFFAGSFCTEETVQGGTGETEDEAVADYFANYADDEIDYWTDWDAEEGVFTVEVFDVHPVGPDDEENYGDWQWMCGHVVEKRVFAWRIEPDPEWEGLNKIVYTPIEENAKSEATPPEPR